jgi:hypothetical protein
VTGTYWVTSEAAPGALEVRTVVYACWTTVGVLK